MPRKKKIDTTPKKGRPKKSTPPNEVIEVIMRKPDVCRKCGALDTLVTYKTKTGTVHKSQYKRCNKCGNAYNIITDLTPGEGIARRFQ